jgi:propanol-preferring alcohol dehydrogenase
MRAMVFDGVGRPLRAATRDVPRAGAGQRLLRVEACGICRTDLHLLDGEVSIAQPPRILGHQIVATVEATGERVGVPWLGWTCGTCRYCTSGRENLCERARFTGRDIDGGFAEYAVADERFCFAIPGDWPAVQAAPLLCAGLIGFRALRMCGDAHRLGLYGFGAASSPGRVNAKTSRPCQRASSAPSGRVPHRSAPPPRWTRRSSSRPTVRSCRSRWMPSTRAAPSSAAAST